VSGVSLDRRIERAGRAVEWLEAQAMVERLLRWAVGTGKLAPGKVDALRAELRDMAPFRSYVAGTWVPPAHITGTDDGAALLAAVDAWEEETTR
jgi:hypothetical protein